MPTVRQVYETALSIMNESDETSYTNRVVGIVNTLIGQCWQMSAEYDTGRRDMWTPVTDIDDEIIGIDMNIALSVMPYGLAAMLYLDEDAGRANSWWGIYQENLADSRRNPAEFEPIVDEYGCREYCDSFGRW